MQVHYQLSTAPFEAIKAPPGQFIWKQPEIPAASYRHLKTKQGHRGRRDLRDPPCVGLDGVRGTIGGRELRAMESSVETGVVLIAFLYENGEGPRSLCVDTETRCAIAENFLPYKIFQDLFGFPDIPTKLITIQ
jgi:hypothetical protein